MNSLQQTFFILTASIFLFSCGKAKEAKQNFDEAKKGIGAYSKIAKEAKKMSEDLQDLSELEPLTSEQFKEWMPDKIGDMKRTGFKNNALGMMNVSSSEATYKDEAGDQEIKVTIIDGAGTGSFAIAGVRMAVAADMEEENEYGYKKTVKHDGTKALEEYKNSGERTTLMFLQDERFGVTVNGDGMQPDDVWNKVDDLNLDKLAKIAK